MIKSPCTVYHWERGMSWRGRKIKYWTLWVLQPSVVEWFRIINVCGASQDLDKRDGDHRLSPWNIQNEWRRCAIAWATCHYHQMMNLFSQKYGLNGEVREPALQLVITNRTHLKKDRIYLSQLVTFLINLILIWTCNTGQMNHFVNVLVSLRWL